MFIDQRYVKIEKNQNQEKSCQKTNFSRKHSLKIHKKNYFLNRMLIIRNDQRCLPFWSDYSSSLILRSPKYLYKYVSFFSHGYEWLFSHGLLHKNNQTKNLFLILYYTTIHIFLNFHIFLVLRVKRDFNDLNCGNYLGLLFKVFE